MSKEKTTKPKVNENFIVDLQGQQFVKYEGLLDMAHQVGLKELTVDLIQIPTKENNYIAICKAVGITDDGKVFMDIGDASPNSVNTMVVPHLIRMSATRAKARVLRDLTNIGMTAIDEVDSEAMTGRKAVVGFDAADILKEAIELQELYLKNGRNEELARITNGRSVKAIGDKEKLSEIVAKLKNGLKK